ncbi:MAG TPA: D-glycero-beta-D-manno-heptose 1-phosphate adenylyltransferase [Candidatus Binatia bacterium]|nr:D-glycero-beta-D-manno-heptose 1-phosphate adenylyltransferase [Candidatus Binatia bacterium]
MPEKLKSAAEVVAVAAEARRRGKRVVFTNGCFDVLHRGHVHLLRQARALGDLLIVGLNSDRSITAIKGPGRPIMDETSRVELIAAMEMVDYLVVFDEADPYKLIEAIKPDVLAKGGDWPMDQVVGADVVEKSGGRVVLIPYLEGFSTTKIIERIRN